MNTHSVLAMTGTAPPMPPPVAPVHHDRPTIIRRVLVVDDSALQRRILSASLRCWGLEVVEAASAEAALDLCAAGSFDLVISDWMMPGMNGLDFCRAFRLIEQENYTYFILLTSKSDKAEVVEGLQVGADDFLSKPVSSEELRARIRAGERMLGVERQLTQNNQFITRTLEELRKVQAALDRDLAEARKLQMSLAPRTTAVYGGARLSFMMEPSGQVGGDLVGQFELSGNRVGMFSLDVSGHGIAAALVTARLAGWLKGSTPDQNVALTLQNGQVTMRPPAEVCAILNRMFMAEIDTEHYFTIALAELDLATGDIRLCQAGHPHPLIQRANGLLDFIGSGGMPIGLIDGAHFAEVRATLGVGDRLFIYSDGLTECPTPDGGMLDEAGLARLFDLHRDRDGEDLLTALSWELSALMDDRCMSDDVSGVLVEFGPQA
jgi:sigma-B regulation protein RsbU (phosphoserine phosphatase)